MRDERAAITQPVAELDRASEKAPPGLLIRLHLRNALADAVALGLGEGSGDRQEQLRQAIARDVSAQIEQVQLDAEGVC